jgi:hypothetical protein
MDVVGVRPDDVRMEECAGEMSQEYEDEDDKMC